MARTRHVFKASRYAHRTYSCYVQHDCITYKMWYQYYRTLVHNGTHNRYSTDESSAQRCPSASLLVPASTPSSVPATTPRALNIKTRRIELPSYYESICLNLKPADLPLAAPGRCTAASACGCAHQGPSEVWPPLARTQLTKLDCPYQALIKADWSEEGPSPPTR